MINAKHNRECILARRVIHRGEIFGLSLIEIDGSEVVVSPFERETANTRFESRTVRILREGYKSDSDWHENGMNPILIYE